MCGMQSEFNPTDTKYESVDDLPEEQQDKFVDFGNGFIRAETAQNYSHDTETARILNSSHSIFDKIL
jgi:hypothetical protein